MKVITNSQEHFKNRSSQIQTREQLAELGKNLPFWVYYLIQVFFTWLTGKPCQGQKFLFESSKDYELITAITSLFGGAIFSGIIFRSSPLLFPLLSISWIVTVGGARKLAICIVHHCVHRNFFGDKRDRILAEVLTTLLFVTGFDRYRYDHVVCHHHIKKFATFEGDPDAKFMLAVGFHPGLKSDRN